MLEEPLLEPTSGQPEAQTYFAGGHRGSAIAGQETPRQNRLLALLPWEDLLRLRPSLVPISLAPGQVVHRAGDQEKYLYFLTAGIVSKFHLTRSGASTGFAIVGNEGVIGVASFLGGESALSEAVVLSAGHAYRLGANAANEEFKRCGALAHLLLRYTQTLMGQSEQIAVCNRHHSLEPQLCRLILSCLDRLPSNELTLTQEVIADMLGVRREGVTDAAGKLQKAGVIRYTRGHIAVLDRTRLEALTCECYEVVKEEYARLMQSVGEPESFLRDGSARFA